MTRYRPLALVLALALPALASSAPLARPQPATLRMPDMPLHDPWIVADRATRTYHLYTRNEPRMSGDPRIGIMAYTSRNLRDWSRPRIVSVIPPGGWANDGAWAPEVHRWRGRWYLFATYHNESAALKVQGVRKLHRRGTTLAVADSLDGPFVSVRNAEPVVDRETMTLDGTLYVDPAKRPWMIYAHEWVQTGDGTIEAVPLNDRLAASGPPRVLFHASAAPWADGKPQAEGDVIRVTDGPELFRTRTGRLLMLWSSYDRTGYVQGLARSRSETLGGPWEQLKPLVRRDSGHGMLFRRFDGTLMMVLHRPFKNARGKLYVMRDTGDRVAIVREATDFDGETDPTHR
ncbi:MULTISPECIES: glycoside hydrolase family 43 protein [unclassified Sphingomonas]|uniref:glycoside hydrolase family 43 protein n=1 Tax=unclassified Sphingomonas TaxID=196159 RepID=UPI0006F26AF5|nr:MULTISPECIES: glycoside hydrolase family 43 protein [unclassified Sphingomonas]KQS51875.1 glycoside hydrolase [Sphingomonas sp. Leaf198]